MTPSNSGRKFPVVAIDGPAGAGKSTVSRQAANALDYLLLDTGAIYRAVALRALERGVVDQPEAVAAIASDLAEQRSLRFERLDGPNEQHVWLADRDISQAIRTPEVSLCASKISVIPAVRAALLELQRSFGRAGRVVVEGRDIGTVVFPDAEAKFYLTASVEARAARRYQELVGREQGITQQRVEAEVRERDRRDSSRPIAPLQQADDARLLDSTHRSAEDIVEEIVRTVHVIEAELGSDL
jgi:CMP/dCMP kinase